MPGSTGTCGVDPSAPSYDAGDRKPGTDGTFSGFPGFPQEESESVTSVPPVPGSPQEESENVPSVPGFFPGFQNDEHPAVWYNLSSRNGQDGARVSRRYLPDRPIGLPEGVGGGQRRQYHHPDGCRTDSCHADRRLQGHDAARRPDYR